MIAEEDIYCARSGKALAHFLRYGRRGTIRVFLYAHTKSGLRRNPC